MQSSIAVSADREKWFLFNAAPDIRSQILTFAPLWPRGNIRQTPVQAVILSDAELDHTLGLLSLRETPVLRLYATEWVHTALMDWSMILRTLGAYCQVAWQTIEIGDVVPLCGLDGVDSGLRCQAFTTLSSKTVAYAGEPKAHPAATVAYRVTDERTGHALVYAPAVQELSAAVRSRLEECDCLLFDGTCWDDDELPKLGISHKTARSMGHIPIAGEAGSLKELAALDIHRKLYIHINNTNPVLIENSPERCAVEAHGIEIAADGLELEI